MLDKTNNGMCLPGFQDIGCHIIFDIDMYGEFTCKERLVAGIHMTDPPVSITYSSVVSRDSARMAFILATLNDIDVYADDIDNSYLNVPRQENIWTISSQ